MLLRGPRQRLHGPGSVRLHARRRQRRQLRGPRMGQGARGPHTSAPRRTQGRHRARAEGAQRGDGGALLRRRRPARPRAGDRRLRVRFARDGALRSRPHGADADRLGRALHGRDRQDPVAAQARADARSRCHLLARPRLPARGLRQVLRRASGPHRGGLCQHQRRREGARRLDGDQFVRAGHRQHLHEQRQEDPVGARSAPGPLRAAADRRRHAVVGRRLHRARRVQGRGARAAAQGPSESA